MRAHSAVHQVTRGVAGGSHEHRPPSRPPLAAAAQRSEPQREHTRAVTATPPCTYDTSSDDRWRFLACVVSHCIGGWLGVLMGGTREAQRAPE
jgi:hypothetical protein